MSERSPTPLLLHPLPRLHVVHPLTGSQVTGSQAVAEGCQPIAEPRVGPRERDASLAPARTIMVREVMSVGVLCVKMSASAVRVAELLVENGVRSVPVVDEDRRLLGIVSKTDLMLARSELATKVAGDIMTPVVHALPEDASLAYAIALMALDSLLEVPIVSYDGQVVGVVTAHDVMNWIACENGFGAPTSWRMPRRYRMITPAKRAPAAT